MLQLLCGSQHRLSHCFCEGCDFSLTDNWQSPGDVLSQEHSHLDGSKLSGVHFTLVLCVMRSSGISAAISCASVRDRIHSSSSNIIVVGSSSFFKNKSCLSSRNRHSSGISPVAHTIGRMSRILKSRLRCQRLRRQ